MEGDVPMQCPVDGETLQIAERTGVEIDYCPKCRGVWLDRGELDKIIDRSAPQAEGWDDHDDRGGKPRKKKRGGFLEELFDF
jgi:Zn-finger nucleic acid-binding protein